ncbi:MAG: sugar phosphate isomerase/epimerase, partial [Planctomycetes bacterium]|nr:sugar phosphate isomerase/epimerase [Planctomycetota bacterium]
MYISGIADEAGRDIDSQIRAHTELGLKHIEVRFVGDQQFTQLSDEEFDAVISQLDAAGLQISCYGSAIANWARPITGDFQEDID